MEIIAAILHFSNFAFSASAAILAVMLFRHYRHRGWLLLAISFLTPFWFLLLRIVQGRPLLTYRSSGPVVDGVAPIESSLGVSGILYDGCGSAAIIDSRCKT